MPDVMSPAEPPTAARDSCAIYVIAKAPRPGHVKTRLQGVLTAEEAAALGTAFLQDTVAALWAASRVAPIAPGIAYAPAGQEGRFDGMFGTAPDLVPPDLVLADGSGGAAPGVEGFGRVLLDAMRTGFARGHRAVCVLGADSPTLPVAELVTAARRLLAGDADAVLGAADDGGYYLLGMTAAHPAPFVDIAWSTETVAAATRARLAGAGLRLVELRPWYDVDDPPALMRLVQELAADGVAVQTAAAVARIGLRARLAAMAS